MDLKIVDACEVNIRFRGLESDDSHIPGFVCYIDKLPLSAQVPHVVALVVCCGPRRLLSLKQTLPIVILDLYVYYSSF